MKLLINLTLFGLLGFKEIQTMVGIDKYKHYGHCISKNLIDRDAMEMVIIPDIISYNKIVEKETISIDKRLSNEYRRTIYILDNAYLIHIDQPEKEGIIIAMNDAILLDFILHVVVFWSKQNGYNVFEVYRNKEVTSILEKHRHKHIKYIKKKDIDLFYLEDTKEYLLITYLIKKQIHSAYLFSNENSLNESKMMEVY